MMKKICMLCVLLAAALLLSSCSVAPVVGRWSVRIDNGSAVVLSAPADEENGTFITFYQDGTLLNENSSSSEKGRYALNGDTLTMATDSRPSSPVAYTLAEGENGTLELTNARRGDPQAFSKASRNASGKGALTGGSKKKEAPAVTGTWNLSGAEGGSATDEFASAMVMVKQMGGSVSVILNEDKTASINLSLMGNEQSQPFTYEIQNNTMTWAIESSPVEFSYTVSGNTLTLEKGDIKLTLTK